MAALKEDKRNTSVEASIKTPLGELIKSLRESLGLTQHELAIKAEMQAAAISSIECGRIQSPTIRTIERLEAALGSSLRHNDEVVEDYVGRSLDKFLSSDVAKSLDLSAKERKELGELKWFNPREKPTVLDWADWIRLRRRVRAVNGGLGSD